MALVRKETFNSMTLDEFMDSLDLRYHCLSKEEFMQEIMQPWKREEDEYLYQSLKRSKEEIAKAYQDYYSLGITDSLDALIPYCPQYLLDKYYYFHIRRSRKTSAYRLMNRIHKMMIISKCVFVTLTFTDETLANTSFITRRKYVSRFLKLCSADYAANIDFGRTHNREHYHAVVAVEKIPPEALQLWRNKCGAVNVEKIRHSKDNKAVALYMTKLFNHAIKLNTGMNNRILYSRSK